MTKIHCDICGKEIEQETDRARISFYRKVPFEEYQIDDNSCFTLCPACSNKLYTILTSKKVKI